MNQHSSRKTELLALLHAAHDWLIQGEVEAAQAFLGLYRDAYAQVPASTRRRWKCGR